MSGFSIIKAKTLNIYTKIGKKAKGNKIRENNNLVRLQKI